MKICKWSFLRDFFFTIRALLAPWDVEDYEPEIIEILTRIDNYFEEAPSLEGYFKSFPFETNDDKLFVEDVMWASKCGYWNFHCKKLHSNLSNTVTILFYSR